MEKYQSYSALQIWGMDVLMWYSRTLRPSGRAYARVRRILSALVGSLT